MKYSGLTDHHQHLSLLSLRPAAAAAAAAAAASAHSPRSPPHPAPRPHLSAQQSLAMILAARKPVSDRRHVSAVNLPTMNSGRVDPTPTYSASSCTHLSSLPQYLPPAPPARHFSEPPHQFRNQRVDSGQRSVSNTHERRRSEAEYQDVVAQLRLYLAIVKLVVCGSTFLYNNILGVIVSM
ncbi:hypothetical protein BZA70DRAFT_285918 [Myxozyma melibiosi]|uniref:Uncharacterized protein n=1 Tax=Myxozyma melibiosi TaxID=54550 RepID=A0ABR1EY28_9ASCO